MTINEEEYMTLPKKFGDGKGAFKRPEQQFRNWISRDRQAEFPAEKDRYHLYVSYACPWAHRTLITRKLKGLEDIITFTVVHWDLRSRGWRFATPEEAEPEKNVTPDPLHPGFTHLRDVYFESKPDYDGRFTVPVLYDKKKKRIVSNESREIIRMLYYEFDHLLPREFAMVDLLPSELQDEIEDTSEWTYFGINDGVYKTGFSTTQESYDNNVKILFKSLDRAEQHLATSPGPYYFGENPTEADIRLYVTLIRFDIVYVQHFKCNIRDIRSGYPALHRWLRHCYWTNAAFRETTNFDHIKCHYTKSHRMINQGGITPAGPLPHILPLDG
ncbi:hypothetical protein M409DRAFT_30314 [Zasmidium cellare ATCC 36951]|uniref:GST C-terminal domain-containing protein n=1 Tax=Zasmidium cellare ATCC 36951 TaxID=1080233 RepID=A0A6A6BWU7_ZASCE|nr:uncharacterized protein M409DRAFT_30314 [Zasmidium cellare ATCC 36951]KAF2159175.1 hypothetical protein M409DRAFT_30314 [Zasmidium cellare ATCC 36951]